MRDLRGIGLDYPGQRPSGGQRVLVIADPNASVDEDWAKQLEAKEQRLADWKQRLSSARHALFIIAVVEFAVAWWILDQGHAILSRLAR